MKEVLINGVKVTFSDAEFHRFVDELESGNGFRHSNEIIDIFVHYTIKDDRPAVKISINESSSFYFLDDKSWDHFIEGIGRLKNG